MPIHPAGPLHLQAPAAMHMQPMLTGLPAPLAPLRTFVTQSGMRQPQRKVTSLGVALVQGWTRCVM